MFTRPLTELLRLEGYETMAVGDAETAFGALQQATGWPGLGSHPHPICGWVRPQFYGGAKRGGQN